MTKHELNRDVKRLYKQYINSISFDTSEKMIREYKRIYYADPKGEYLTNLSLRMMIRMNHTFRIIPLHQMYINLKI